MIYLVGDSQAEGLGPHVPASWRAFPFRGYSTARLKGELRAIPFGRGDTVVLVTGGNDDPDSSALPGTVRATAADVLSRGAALIWVGPVHAKVQPDAQVHPRTAAIHRAALPPGVRWIDAAPLTRDLARSTNVHLDRTGYRTYAARLEAAMRGSGSGLAYAGALALALTGAWALTRTRA